MLSAQELKQQIEIAQSSGWWTNRLLGNKSKCSNLPLTLKFPELSSSITISYIELLLVTYQIRKCHAYSTRAKATNIDN